MHYYSIEERLDRGGNWVAVKGVRFDNANEAMKDADRKRVVFGGTPGCRFLFSRVEPQGFEWETDEAYEARQKT